MPGIDYRRRPRRLIPTLEAYANNLKTGDERPEDVDEMMIFMALFADIFQWRGDDSGTLELAEEGRQLYHQRPPRS